MELSGVREGIDNVVLEIALLGSEEVLFLCNYKRGKVKFHLPYYRRSRELN